MMHDLIQSLCIFLVALAICAFAVCAWYIITDFEVWWLVGLAGSVLLFFGAAGTGAYFEDRWQQ